MSSAPARDLRVFVNCPFDDKYIKIFHAIVFAIHDVGFQARHALIDNSSVLRIRRIYEEVEGSLYSIHELGQVALSPKSKLPRFNMPFEAGIAYSMHEAGAKGRAATSHAAARQDPVSNSSIRERRRGN